MIAEVEQNDPTASGFAPPASGAASLSLNEVESLCLKAARGAGMDWGLAEEAGFAARWLHAGGIDGASALLRHLDWMQGRDRDALRPATVGGRRPAAAGECLCPVALGATLSDAGVLPGAPVGPAHAPVLLLPFLHHIALATDRAVTARWSGGAVAVGPDGGISGDAAALEVAGVAELALGAGARAAGDPAGRARPLPLAAATLARLDTYALRTAVPVSSASRADAGSATGDSD